MSEELTIRKQLEEIAKDFCDNFCKYSAQASESDGGYLVTICDEKCPLNRL